MMLLAQELPADWQCPVCGAPKNTFQTKEVTVAGFAQNQKCALPMLGQRLLFRLTEM
jgi:Rubredoxin